MGIVANFTVAQVMRDLNTPVRVTSEKIEDALEEATEEATFTLQDLVPYKTGTLQESIDWQRSGRGWKVIIRENAKVPRSKARVRDYLYKMEYGLFQSLGKLSIEKESYSNKRRLASLGVRRSRFGTYVGDQFMARVGSAVLKKWDKRIRKLYKTEMRKAARRRR
jgi:hypothetical protein